jgi:hypothetical protein
VEQYKLMELGGNNRAKNYFQKNGIGTKKIPQKYVSSAAKLYKKELQHLVEQEYFFQKNFKISRLGNVKKDEQDVEEENVEDDEPKTAPSRLDNDKHFDFLQSVKEDSEKQQYKIVSKEKTEKIIIQKKSKFFPF